VPIIRYAATTTPYKGMVLTNPGGPGGSGVQFLMEAVDLGTGIVGTNYDWVSWDPRGIGASIPAANCTIPANLRRRGLEPLTGPELASVYFEDTYTQSFEIGIACEDSIGAQNQAGPHVTTATVVRDMISIVDAHAASDRGKSCDDASLLNYWGFSYGTFLGQTFISMFPHRLGRVVLDGVLNPIDWVEGTGQNLITSSDDVVSLFFVYCNAAGPENCPFYTGTTAHDVYLRFEAIVSRLNATYAFQQGWSNATAIETLLEALKFEIFESIYQPIGGYPLIAEALVAVEAIVPDVTLAALEELAQELGLNLTGGVTPDSLWERAILCSDTGGVGYNRTLAQIMSLVPGLESESYIGGEFIFQDIIACAGWPITSDYRYPGTFNVT
jgi:pimeloyl-ACP methyl ester carboxylesterase